MMEILRIPLLERLESMAAAGHLLVVGEPGAGKSWLLKSFVTRRKSANESVVFVRAEDHVVNSLDELFRSIGTRDFVAALRAFTGSKKYLVIDSLDALRAEPSQRAFRDLIRLVQAEVPEFRIVASMRTFDSEQSIEFQLLFPSIGLDDPDALSITARHVHVPVFSDAEVEEALSLDPRLRPIFDSASSVGKTLLRNPFNLWLVIHLLNAHVPVDWLSTIQSEVQLLDKYWQFRVESRANMLARTKLLTKITEQMVGSNTLSVSIRDVTTDSGFDIALKDLLSDEILVKTESNRLSFTHNILFDFALSYLLLDETNLLEFIGAAPARSLFYRPSLIYFLARIWFKDRGLFWQSVKPLFDAPPEVSATLPITPATVIFDVAQTSQDVEPIFQLSDSAGTRATVFLLRSVLVFEGFRKEKRSLWLPVLSKVLASMKVTYVNECLGLIKDGFRRQDLSLSEKVTLVACATKLLRWLWEKGETSELSMAQNLSGVGAAVLIPLVMSNYAVSPADAKQVLQDVLHRFGNLKASPNEAFQIANSIDAVIEDDPDTAGEFFVGVLGFADSVDEETNFGGAILPLRSNRAQDFSIAHYVLEQKFGRLLQRDTHIAAKTVGRAINAEIKLKEGDTVTQLSAYERKFKYAGADVEIISDRSDIWDQSSKDYTSLKLLEQLLHWLDGKAKEGGVTPTTIRDTLKALAVVNRYAVTWKRIINFASHSDALLSANYSLFLVPEILGGPETNYSAGKALEIAFAKNLYTPAENKVIEAAILDVPTSLKDVYKDATPLRNRLLGCIPESILGADSLKILHELKKTTGVPKNVPTFQIGPVTYGQPPEDDWLKRQGVEVDRPDNRVLLEAGKPLQSFASRFVNEAPSESDYSGVVEQLSRAAALIKSTLSADERIITDVLTSATGVAAAIVRNSSLTKDSPEILTCRSVLLVGATHPHPEPNKNADANFDRPMWSPTPKIEAAQGLMRYVARFGMDEETREAIQMLSRDRSPAVRFQIASALTGLYEKNRDIFWQIAAERRKNENATGVLVEIARSSTHPYIAKMEREVVLQWQAELLSRELPKERRGDVLNILANSLTHLYVFSNDLKARELLSRFQSWQFSKQLTQVGQSACSGLLEGMDSGMTAGIDVRKRARELILWVFTAARTILENPAEQNVPGTESDEDGDDNPIRRALHIIDSTVFQLYLVIGVNPKLVRENVKPATEIARRVLFSELAGIFSYLTSPPPNGTHVLAAQTTHHLMELFTFTASYDPAVVLQFVRNLLHAFNWGYQFDSMAKDEVVKFADIILADYKDILREPINAVNLEAILAVFVEAGWPEATQLLMKLDSVVR